MKLILCSEDDVTAAWVYATFKSLGCSDLELVTSLDLAYAARWNHSITRDSCTTEIHLQDERRIDLMLVDGAINRLTWPSRALIGQAAREDQDYAWTEMFAFYLSWLHALPKRYSIARHRRDCADRGDRRRNGWCSPARRVFTSSPVAGQRCHGRGRLWMGTC